MYSVITLINIIKILKIEIIDLYNFNELFNYLKFFVKVHLLTE